MSLLHLHFCELLITLVTKGLGISIFLPDAVTLRCQYVAKLEIPAKCLLYMQVSL